MSKILLDIIECAVHDDNHLVEEPFSLSCGHSACKNCVKETKFDSIICKKCNETNVFNFENCKASLGLKNLIEKHLDDMFKLTGERFKKAIEELKSKCLYNL